MLNLNDLDYELYAEGGKVHLVVDESGPGFTLNAKLSANPGPALEKMKEIIPGKWDDFVVDTAVGQLAARGKVRLGAGGKFAQGLADPASN